MEFISFGPEYTNEEIANCLLADLSDDDQVDKGTDSADSLTDYSDSDFVDTDEVIMDPIAALSTPSKSTIRSTPSRFATPSRSIRKSINVKKTPGARRPSAVFVVYPDPDALGGMPQLTPIRGLPPSPLPQNGPVPQGDPATPAQASSSKALAVTGPPATPGGAATSFHWMQTPTSTVPVFPKIATTETILYSVRKPAQDVIDVDSGSESDTEREDAGDIEEDFMQVDQGSSAAAPRTAASGLRSGTKAKMQKESIATRLTKPEEFSFMKRQRAPLRVVSSPAIRRHKSIKIRRPLRPTIMAPTVASLVRTNPPCTPYVPMAERIQQFMATPPRFKNKSHAMTRAGAAGSTRQPRIREPQHRPPGVTIPQSPMLRTKHLRKQPLSTMSAAEREELLVQQMKKEQFKARPLDRKIFQTDHPLGVPERKPFQPTAPHSPAITKVNSKRPAPPSPTPSASAKASKSDGKPTQIEPFHLPGEAFAASKRQELEKRLQREEEEMQKKREFRAQPLPKAVVVSKPIVPEIHSTKPLTEPKPFTLRTDTRVGTGPHEPAPIQVPEFRARPVPLSTYTEFPVAHSDKPPTMPDLAPHLHTEDRAEQRREFDERVAQHRALEELQAQREAAERERALKHFIRELRRDLVHKARRAPSEILQGPTFVPQPSARAPTVPESPAIGKKRKAAVLAGRGRNEDAERIEERKRARWAWSTLPPELLDAQAMEQGAMDNDIMGKDKGVGDHVVAPAAMEVEQLAENGEDELDMTMWTLPQVDAEWLMGESSSANGGSGK
ncbi:hypothetical protein BCR44DRAFT_218848 [Catenaria anguillulae PL171]|uniref:TPX2 C-terminal domain-containing protein n=1 Tax=Catenaria anguillulae PL171 TaxID=765915 RepID=A0A1Y2HWH6_9FUNG|nr:hypothetical protein BCR44DRAFT_218848 [Catenaria anguillulae PL171]